MRLSKIFSSSLVKTQAAYFLITFIQSALPLLLLPVLAAYLSTAEYGSIALFTFYYAVILTLIGTSITFTISKNFFKYSHDGFSLLITHSIWVTLFLTVLISSFFIIFKSFIISVIDLPYFWIMMLPWVAFSFSTFNIVTLILRLEKKVKFFGLFKISHIFINVLISLILVVLFAKGWQGRVWGMSLSLFLALLLSFAYLNRKDYIRFTFDFNIFSEQLGALKKLVPYALQMIILTQVGIFFMEYHFSKNTLGIYFAAFQISVAIKLLSTALSLSWGPFVYKALNEKTINKEKITLYYWVLLIIMTAGLVCIISLSSFIVQLLVTPDYYSATEYIPLLSCGFFLSGVSIFLTPILIHFDDEKWLSRLSIVATVLAVVLNMFLPTIYGSIGIAYAFCLMYLFLCIGTFWRVQYKLLPLPWLDTIPKGLTLLKSKIKE